MLQKIQVKPSLYCAVLLSHHAMATAASYYILLCHLDTPTVTCAVLAM